MIVTNCTAFLIHCKYKCLWKGSAGYICHENIDAVQEGNTVKLFNNSAATVAVGSSRQVRFVCGVFHLFCRS